MALLKGRFIRLENQRFLKGKKVDGSDKDILKVNEEDKIEFSESPVLSEDPSAPEHAARKGYVDAVGSAAQAYADEQVSQEASSREAADMALDARVATIESSTSDRDYVDSKVLEEKTAREAADTAIDGRLDALEADPVTKAQVDAGDQASKDYADQKIADLINGAPGMLDTLKELADAIAAGETVSQGLLSQIGQANTRIDQEITNRTNADQVLDAKIDQEISDRQAAVSALQTSLATEVTARSNGDAALLAKLDASTYYHELHVNFDYLGAVSDGSPYAPFKTIQAAVDAACAPGRSGANAAVIIHLKKNTSVSENITINSAVANIYLTPAYSNNTDSSPIRIDGTLTIGGTSNRVRVKDIQFYNASSPALVINGGQGRHMFQNCQFSGGGGVSFTGSYQRWYEFIDCSVEGPVTFGGTPLAGTLISMYRPRLASASLTVSHANAMVAMYDVYGMGAVTHSAGTLAITGMWGWGAGTFNSTAASPGFLSLSNVSMQKTDLSFAKINKTGTALFQLKDVQRDESQDVLSGTRVAFGSSLADEKFVPAVAASWSASSLSGKAALDEVMAKAKTVESGLASEVTARTSGDSALQTAISNEVTARQAGDTAEAAARQAADQALSGRIATLEADPTTKTYVDSKVLVEAQARQAADSTEAAARQAGDTTLQGNINTLAGVVQGNFDLQQSDIDGLRSDVDALTENKADKSALETEKARIDAILLASDADKDSFAEIVQLINSVDTENDQAFAAYVLSNNAALAQEVSDREAGDSALSGRLDVLEQDPTTKSYVDGKFDEEKTAREQAVASEMARAQGEESRIEGKVDDEIANRLSGDQSVQASVDAEVARAQGEESRIEAKVDQEILDRQTGDSASQAYTDSKIGNLEGNPDVATFVGQLAASVFGQVASEQAAREAADTELDARLDVLEAAPQVQGQKFGANLSAQDIVNGYIEMPFEPMPMTLIVAVSGLIHTEEEDYMVSTTDGVTRISFVGDLAANLQEGDKVRVQFLKLVASGNGGGGGGGGGGGEPSLAITSVDVLIADPAQNYAEINLNFTGTATMWRIYKNQGGSWAYYNEVSGSFTGPLSLGQIMRGPSQETYKAMVLDGLGGSSEMEFVVPANV